jgi:glycosyltransferase involved in cell wall biosynthesis
MNAESVKYDLIIVMPVYNEEGAIITVINNWLNVLNYLSINYQIRLYNDGSKDKTSLIVKESFGHISQVKLIDKPNSGHGPTILLGYKQAVDSDWILQIDSDDEMQAEPFKQLWMNRDNYDFLIAYRGNRNSTFLRSCLSFFSRMTVRILFGNGVYDVNSPYRLMRTSVFNNIFHKIPDSTFAPNVIVSGYVNKRHIKYFSVEIPFKFRTTGTVSIKSWKFIKVSLKSFGQICLFMLKNKI